MARTPWPAILALMFGMLAGSPGPGNLAAQSFDPAVHRLVDLSHDYGPDTLYWPTSPSAFEVETLSAGDTPGGFYYSAYAFCTPEHGGTHLDAPVHFARGQRTADQVPLVQLVAPAVVIDVSAKASSASDASYRLTVDDVREFERRHGRIARGTMVLLRTGWSRHWSDRKAYFGDDTPGDASKLRFPSFGLEAAQLLVRERGVGVLGVDTASIDYGPSSDFPVHRLAAAENVVGLENLTALEELPRTGATIIALPMKIRGGSGGPVRVVAAIPSYAQGASGPGRDVPFILPVTAAGARLHDPGVVFLHLGDKAGYEAAHIPGARFIELSAISRPRGESDPLRLELADPASLVATFEGLGISDRSHVIVYFGKDWATPAARVFFALDYIGLGHRVSYLDGGLPAWQAAGLPVTTDVPSAASGRIASRPNAAALADLAAVAAARATPSASIVDARDRQFYTGDDDAQGRYKRPGHIAGALSVPFTTLLTPAGHFKTPDELRAIFREAGIGERDTVTAYCHIGQQASLVYFVARMLGHEARLYDGSFEEWTNRPEAQAPVEKGTGSGR